MSTDEELVAAARYQATTMRISYPRLTVKSALFDRLADALEATLPKEVQTVEGLDALAEGSVIIDNSGDVSERRGGLWCGYETDRMDSHRMRKFLPARVLFTPTKNGEGS